MSNSNGRWEFDENGNARYVPPTQSGGSSGNRKKDPDEGWHWIFIVLAFMIFWPLGLIALFLHMTGKWPTSRINTRRATNTAQHIFAQAAQSAQQSSADAAARWQAAVEETRAAQQRQQEEKNRKKQTKQKKQKQDDGSAYGLGNIGLLRGIGIGMTALFGFVFLMELYDELYYFYTWRYLIGETLPLLAFTLAGCTFLGIAGSRRRKLRLFLKYMSVIGDRQIVPISSLAASMGRSEKKVEKDLEEMLSRGFWESGYVDLARRALVLDGSLADIPTDEPAPEPEPASDDTAAATLRRIRELNDTIPGAEISRKIDRIEELTAKIFHLLEERPEKAGELRSFLNYYLPQTLKILENYSRLEAQGVEGENIAGAKQQIESMMDKLVDGYEAQLDKLFAGDVLDITADLKVMESMLEKDGLTVDNELHF